MSFYDFGVFNTLAEDESRLEREIRRDRRELVLPRPDNFSAIPVPEPVVQVGLYATGISERDRLAFFEALRLDDTVIRLTPGCEIELQYLGYEPETPEEIQAALAQESEETGCPVG